MTKFKTEHDEYIWSGSVESGAVTGDGDVAGPVGWFAAVTLQPGFQPEEDAALRHYGTPFLILHESNEGFITVLTFEKQTDRDRRLRELEQAHGLGEAGVTDGEIKEAIDNYLQALVFAAGLDDKTPHWSPESQQRAVDDVMDFVIQNIESIRGWQESTGHDWVQVGIDFALTRNREGAGFWSRDNSGTAGLDLTEASHAWGEITVQINEDGEVEFA